MNGSENPQRGCISIFHSLHIEPLTSVCLVQPFSKKEQEDVDFAVQDGIDVVKTILAQGMERALSGIRSGANVA